MSTKHDLEQLLSENRALRRALEREREAHALALAHWASDQSEVQRQARMIRTLEPMAKAYQSCKAELEALASRMGVAVRPPGWLPGSRAQDGPERLCREWARRGTPEALNVAAGIALAALVPAVADDQRTTKGGPHGG